MLQRYENDRTVMKNVTKGDNFNGRMGHIERYAVDQLWSEPEMGATLDDSPNSNLLLPLIKKRSQSFRQEAMIRSDNRIG